jgi:site-specific DNA-methyltransferase (adenine-specific)
MVNGDWTDLPTFAARLMDDRKTGSEQDLALVQNGVKPDDVAVHNFVGGESCIVAGGYGRSFAEYLASCKLTPLLFHGDAAKVLADIPEETIDCIMTSPPYWGKREYDSGGIGQEVNPDEYVRALAIVFEQVKRVLKPTGSFWLNIGDTYNDKGLCGIPWRVAFHLIDRQGWVMRNSVIWNKVKSGMDNSKDRLGNIHEDVFHFVKEPKGYYYNADAIRSQPQSARIENGAVVSPTGVSGVRYRRQIDRSVELSDVEKAAARAALDNILDEMRGGLVADFRMIIRGNQRATHSDREKVSGRAKELRDKGFYILRYHPKGSKPADVWDIIPEDTQRREIHFAPYPIELCRIPILATCPPSGTVLDPFCGTGTTLLAASMFGRQSVGVDCSFRYLEYADNRCQRLL